MDQLKIISIHLFQKYISSYNISVGFAIVLSYSRVTEDKSTQSGKSTREIFGHLVTLEGFPAMTI